MGAEWHIPNTELIFKCGVKNFPSSTCPGLMAILTALLAIPINRQITIYTDSQAAIDCVKGIMNTDNMQRILKMANNIILCVIKQLILSKNLQFKMVKIKGHTGICDNKCADILAKRRLNM